MSNSWFSSHCFCNMCSDPYYKFIIVVHSRFLKSELLIYVLLVCSNVNKSQFFKSGWTQLVRIELPVAKTEVYLCSTPEPATPTVCSRAVCVRQRWGEPADSEEMRKGEHRCLGVIVMGRAG